jgi:hypothetical protein
MRSGTKGSAEFTAPGLDGGDGLAGGHMVTGADVVERAAPDAPVEEVEILADALLVYIGGGALAGLGDQDLFGDVPAVVDQNPVDQVGILKGFHRGARHALLARLKEDRHEARKLPAA